MKNPDIRINGRNYKTLIILFSMFVAGCLSNGDKISADKSSLLIDTSFVFISTNTIAYYYRNGTGGNEVHYYKISGHYHIWPGSDVTKAGYTDNSGIDAVDIVWDFFSRY